MMLKIDTIGDKVYKDLIKGLQTKKSSSRPIQTNLARRGGIFRNNNQTVRPQTNNNNNNQPFLKEQLIIQLYFEH